MKLYFAGPLFCNAEKEFNKKLTEQIEALGYHVFLPQRDGVSENSPKAIFDLDKKEMMTSDIFLFVLDGRIPDEGACVALGMSYMHKQFVNQNILLIGLHTDKRGAYVNSKLNPMLEASMDSIFESVSELLKYLSNL